MPADSLLVFQFCYIRFILSNGFRPLQVSLLSTSFEQVLIEFAIKHKSLRDSNLEVCLGSFILARLGTVVDRVLVLDYDLY